MTAARGGADFNVQYRGVQIVPEPWQLNDSEAL